jgi:hypothetical protein
VFLLRPEPSKVAYARFLARGSLSVPSMSPTDPASAISFPCEVAYTHADTSPGIAPRFEYVPELRFLVFDLSSLSECTKIGHLIHARERAIDEKRRFNYVWASAVSPK